MMTNVYQAAGRWWRHASRHVTCQSDWREIFAGTGYVIVGRHSVVRGHWCHQQQQIADSRQVQRGDEKEEVKKEAQRREDREEEKEIEGEEERRGERREERRKGEEQNRV